MNMSVLVLPLCRRSAREFYIQQVLSYYSTVRTVLLCMRTRVGRSLLPERAALPAKGKKLDHGQCASQRENCPWKYAELLRGRTGMEKGGEYAKGKKGGRGYCRGPIDCAKEERERGRQISERSMLLESE